MPARRDAVTRFRARQGGCSPSAADSPIKTQPGHRSRPSRSTRAGGSLWPASNAGRLDARREQRGSNNPCGSFARLTHDPTPTRANKRNPLRSPPGRSPARIAGDPGSPPSRRRRWHCGSPPRSGCVVSRVHRPSHVGEPFSSRSAVMPPAFPSAHYLPYAQDALLRSESGTLSGHPPDAFLT
jgi:hypothetical protein